MSLWQKLITKHIRT